MKVVDTDASTPNVVFKDYVTSGIFNLSLTRNMIQTLTAVYVGKRSWIPVTHGPTSLQSLERRGLTESLRSRIGEEGIRELSQKEGWLYSGEWLMAQPYARIQWLTEAGLLVIGLLKEAGLVDSTLEACARIKEPWKPKSKKWREEHFHKSFHDAVYQG